MGTLILATGNRHKADEIRALLGAELCCQTPAHSPGVYVAVAGHTQQRLRRGSKVGAAGLIPL